MGDEKVEFSRHGIRIALLSEDGTKMEDFDHWDLDMFGGVLPNVGDHLMTLWPGKDPDSEDHHRVLGRYYVGEFAGDNCWWLLVAPEPVSTREKQLFKLARKASAETRRAASARSDYADLARLRLGLETKKPRAPRRKPGTKGSTTRRPKSQP